MTADSGAPDAAESTQTSPKDRQYSPKDRQYSPRDRSSTPVYDNMDFIDKLAMDNNVATTAPVRL